MIIRNQYGGGCALRLVEIQPGRLKIDVGIYVSRSLNIGFMANSVQRTKIFDWIAARLIFLHCVSSNVSSHYWL